MQVGEPSPREKQRQDCMHHNRRPQERPDPIASNAETQKIRHGKRAVGQHPAKCAGSRRARPAGSTQCDQSNAEHARYRDGNPVRSAPNNNRTTIGGYTSRTSPVRASAAAATARSRFFISKRGNALNNPKRGDATDAVRRDAPGPCWLRYGRASNEPSRQRHDTQDRSR